MKRSSVLAFCESCCFVRVSNYRVDQGGGRLQKPVVNGTLSISRGRGSRSVYKSDRIKVLFFFPSPKKAVLTDVRVKFSLLIANLSAWK